MTSRKALIIGAPDDKIPGVRVDIENLWRYLKSSVGGLWYDREITILVSPTVREIQREIELLRGGDYSFVFFAGHGFHSIERKRTMLHINSKEVFDSLELRGGAQKHSLILDCCRKPERESRFIKEAMVASLSMEDELLNPLKCRRCFDDAISECGEGVVVMNSCSINETAGEGELRGGYYTSSLIDSANEWAKNNISAMRFRGQCAIFTTQECHNEAAMHVKSLSGGRQTPNFESPRTDKKFPFTVVA